MKSDCAVIVFAKAPVPGYAKTRLAAAIGAEAAAGLATRMLETTVAAAVDAGVGPVELCCTPDMSHPAFMRAMQVHGISLTQQGDGDLGERMHRALSRTLEHYSRALLIGTDAPRLDALRLREAASALQTHAAVFGPVSDGGYVLVGLSQPMPALFEDMPWSTADVMPRTRERLHRLGATAVEMPLLEDVDEPSDLVHVPREWLE